MRGSGLGSILTAHIRAGLVHIITNDSAILEFIVGFLKYFERH